MKKIIIMTAVFAIAFVAGNAYAEEVTIEATAKTSDGKTIKVPIRAQVKEVRVETKATVKEKRDDLKSEIETRKQELETKRADEKTELRAEAKIKAGKSIAKTIEKSVERLTRELRRFREIQAKIETRLTKLESRGADVTEARTVLAVAITKLSAAEVSIKAISAVTVSAEDPRSSLDAVKTTVRTAQDALKEAHKSLSDVLPAMKGLEASIRRSATSTKATN
ncbi:MAG: hypothetical protein Q7R72_00480 [bacterium]|nr:hypothetical protein [bacterium]